jgi:hypothetical protein
MKFSELPEDLLVYIFEHGFDGPDENGDYISASGQEGEVMLERIADHFEHCQECRKAFDAQEYPEKTLVEFANERLAPNPALESWICKE